MNSEEAKMAFTPFHSLADWSTALAPLAGWPEATGSMQVSERAAGLWVRFRTWQARRQTARSLSALDTRTLMDIGISRSEIDSLIYEPNRNRRRRYDPDWWRKGR